MLIESPPNSISTTLSVATDRGLQSDMDLLCDWSQCRKNWQKLKCGECPWESCRKAISTGDEESKLSSTGIVELSRFSSDLSVANNMCACSEPKMDGFVYKRRKLRQNSVGLLSEENATNSTKASAGCHYSISSKNHFMTMQKDVLHRAPKTDCAGAILDCGNQATSQWQHLPESSSILYSNIIQASNSESDPDSVLSINRCSVTDVILPTEISISNHLESALELKHRRVDSGSSSKSTPGHGSTCIKTKVEDDGECSSSDHIVAEPLEEYSSAKELCISVLKRHGILGKLCTSSSSTSLEIEVSDSDNLSQPCKVCGRSENPRKMLICDLCEGLFHVSCCNPKVKKLPVDEWYCQPCFRKKPKALLKKNSGKTFNIVPGNRDRLHRGLGPISSMLRDDQPYTTGVGVGQEFQVEVPDWAGPISEDNDYFAETSELDPAECGRLNGWSCDMPSKPSSIGNWIQCRGKIYSDTNVTVCGKWRRAPLFSVQTNDWDCSCSVQWDPIHADCAVPQELETDIILKHLKYVEMLRPRLAMSKQRPLRNQK